MSQYENIFTDVVKDVIGNDPVLDQFDISYEASFYGSMQDDFITGSILSVSDSLVAGVKSKVFTTGERGKAFSKYFAESAPPLDSTYGSVEVGKNPSLAYRLVPWHERASSTAYRITQAYDESERYYDSCLPDLNTCFSANGSQIWTTTSDNTSVMHTQLSPYGNVVTSSVGYMFFNSYEADRSTDGYETDPLVNNDWTWSYPYEGKYEPNKRSTSTNDALGLDKIKISADWATDIDDSVWAMQPTNFRKLTKIKTAKSFFPLLPGHLNSQELAASNGRNALRSVYQTTAGGSSTYTIAATYASSSFDDNCGISFMIPADVNLGKYGDHNYLSTYSIADPGPSLLTGTMSTDDTVKFLFGFGDLNNMTYGYRLFNSSSMVASSDAEGFESYTNGDDPRSFGYTVVDPNLTVDWRSSPGSNMWTVSEAVDASYISASMGFSEIPTGLSPIEYLYWYTAGSVPSTATGIYWPLATYGFDVKVLVSATGMQPADSSRASLDITSSLPWSLKYDRCIAASSSDALYVYFSGIPGTPTHQLADKSDEVSLLIESLSSEHPNYGILSTYDTLKNGFWGSVGEQLFPPGEWQLNFKFARQGGASSGFDRAAVDNIEIDLYSLEPDTTGQKIGGNNYPKFRTVRLDGRPNPTFSDSSIEVDYSKNIYKSYIFGISPVIRGWKYGLYSGLPMNSKTIFRRERFGQFRDMLEQRQYTKFINVTGNSPVDNDAVSSSKSRLTKANLSTGGGSAGALGPAVAEVKFVRQRYTVDDRGIGKIYSEKVDPLLTVSQNLSTEVTSSVPYVDGIARHRQESDFSPFSNSTLTSLSISPSGLTVK